MYKMLVKGFCDRLMALLALVIAIPILLITAFLLAIYQKGDVFFTQLRPGKNEKLFKVIKFKTMNDKMDSNGNLLPDEKRLTGIGKLVRKFSMDEIPQLINVLKGDMSLIGPRPWLPEYLPMYNDFQRRRHEVKPGITGWAQVHGRNQLDWDERFKYDIYYVDNISFILDVNIFFLTIWNIFRAKGISGKKSVTMHKFEGNNG